MESKNKLKRGLSTRHIRFMALGSAIGTGLFYGSADAIKMAGPSVLLAYIIGGVAAYIIMRALGEMSVHNPAASSFSRYAQENLGPLAGYITGWTYCFEILIVAIADVTAFGIYMGVWFPTVPHWIWVLSVVLIICAVNLMSVKVFGELEFWFSFFKVATIIIMIVAGFGIIIWGIGNGGQPTGIHNLWSNGGFFSNGWLGMVMSLQMVMFAYGGIEIIGITAGEAKDPEKSIPRAINSVPMRILVFYVGTLFVIMSIYPWNQVGTAGSPVCGHLGLTPQSVHKFGGYGLRAKEEAEAAKLVSDAKALDEVGCFAIVLEKVPAAIASEVARQVKAVTIGIGAGSGCDGQVLVYADALGMTSGFKPKFLRHFAQVGQCMATGVEEYVKCVKEGSFPGEAESY